MFLNLCLTSVSSFLVCLVSYRYVSYKKTCILYKKLLEKIKTIMYFKLSVIKDVMKEEKVSKTVARIKCYHK